MAESYDLNYCIFIQYYCKKHYNDKKMLIRLHFFIMFVYLCVLNMGSI